MQHKNIRSNKEVRTMKSVFNWVTSLMLAGGTWGLSAALTSAHAVNDLPGGPAVDQLNLHPAVTKIARRASSGCTGSCSSFAPVMFVAVFGGHVLFHLETPQVGGPQASPISMKALTVEIAWTARAFHHRDRDGPAGDQSGGCHEGHHQR